MNVKQIRRWKRTRSLGKSRFILKYVLILELIPILTWVSLIIISYVFSISSVFDPNYPIKFLIIGLVLFSIVGYFSSHFVWRATEEKYLKSVPTG